MGPAWVLRTGVFGWEYWGAGVGRWWCWRVDDLEQPHAPGSRWIPENPTESSCAVTPTLLHSLSPRPTGTYLITWSN